MKAPLNLSSAIEKAVVIFAFLPVITMVYPEITSAAHSPQDIGEKALVFQVNSKQTPNLQSNQIVVEEENPTLKNPCYPAPADSCNPNVNPLAQTAVAEIKPASTPVANSYAGRSYTKEEVEALIVAYSAQYGIDPQTPKCIAFHESGYNQFSKNKRSTASGVFQYLNSTWKATDEGKAGHSVFDADANVKAAVKYMAVHKKTTPWMVRGKCPALSFVK
ncbi:TPA: hypothetical protein DCG61_02595 [Patescibacteria group bacterium]|jgi:hypothetical protein|nr:hypothetical protein [Patescibacteria group bacterium]